MTADTPWRWAMLGLVPGALLAAVTFAPAIWLADGLATLSGGQVQLPQSRGTVWDVSAGLLLTGGADSRDASTAPARRARRAGRAGVACDAFMYVSIVSDKPDLHASSRSARDL